MSKLRESFKELYESTLLSLSKEELIQIIEMYKSCCNKIAIVCIEESEGCIESSDAMDNIKGYLDQYHFKFFDEENLRRDLEI